MELIEYLKLSLVVCWCLLVSSVMLLPVNVSQCLLLLVVFSQCPLPADISWCLQVSAAICSCLLVSATVCCLSLYVCWSAELLSDSVCWEMLLVSLFGIMGPLISTRAGKCGSQPPASAVTIPRNNVKSCVIFHPVSIAVSYNGFVIFPQNCSSHLQNMLNSK